MNTKLAAITLAMTLLSGCAVIRVGPPGNSTGKSGSALSSGGGSAKCDNNQYWDGSMCRHKGRGSGARKHDG